MAKGHPDYMISVLGPVAQVSYVERRSDLWNDGSPVAPAAPPAFRTGVADYGKFFTRGCRGKIGAIGIYCMRTAAGTLKLSLSPHPCLGPLYTVTVTPGAAWGWVYAAFQTMWNYDSLFIWVSACSADVSYGYDLLSPADAHHTTDGGATWDTMWSRYFIRVAHRGQTPGDVPVSGIVNNIPIPNVSSLKLGGSQEIDQNVKTEVVDIVGAGYVDLCFFNVNAGASSHKTRWFIEIDGTEMQVEDYDDVAVLGLNPVSQPCAILKYGEDKTCVIMLTRTWEFRRRFRVLALNILANVTVWERVYANMMR